MELDREQQAVVASAASQMVVSGPGSGKTRVLTEKARTLFDQGRDILCLTFTRSAAKEMASRVPGLPAMTIHSFCCGAVGWKEEWGYGGLLWRFLMRQNEGSRRLEHFQNVLLDEAQDVNELELDVVLSLLGQGGNLFAVGDPYQSIYGFQGALGPRVVEILRGRGLSIVELHNNYRSCPEVVDRLNGWFPRGLVSRGVKDTGMTAILCRKNDDLFLVSSYLRGVGVPHRVRLAAGGTGERQRREYDVLGESRITIMTVHVSKGMEFDRVILFDWSPDGDDEERRIFYVALSRASKEFLEVRNLEEVARVVRGAEPSPSCGESTPPDEGVDCPLGKGRESANA